MANFFTYEERLTLQKLLKEGLSFKKIAAQLSKDPSTIFREVRKYAVEISTGKPGYSFNSCKNRMTCKIKAPALCGKDCTRKGSSGTVCRLCRCNEHCPDFVEEVCAVRVHVPYVCNACPTIDKCTLLKTFYDAEKAHLKSHQVISESRSGLSTSEEQPFDPKHYRDKFKQYVSAIDGVRELTPHSCRHTYVSQMQALGVDLATIQSMVGHADLDMTQHYLHVQAPVKQKAIQVFDQAFCVA